MDKYICQSNTDLNRRITFIKHDIKKYTVYSGSLAEKSSTYLPSVSTGFSHSVPSPSQNQAKVHDKPAFAQRQLQAVHYEACIHTQQAQPVPCEQTHVS